MRTPKGKEVSYTPLVVFIGIAFIVALGLHLNRLSDVDDVKRAELLSVQELELKYNIEVLMPSPLELQEWCWRKGANLSLDNELGDETEDAMDLVRCQQEASKHNYEVEKEFWQ